MRPNFLSNPGLWLRPHRMLRNPTEYACALEIPVGRRSLFWRIWKAVVR